MHPEALTVDAKDVMATRGQTRKKAKPSGKRAARKPARRKAQPVPVQDSELAEWFALPLYLNMRERSLRDPLTGLYHRNRMLDELDLVMLMARTHKHPFSVVVMDLDNLQGIIDRHDRATGDRVLLESADLLRQSARVMDFICRTGGDDFAVILPKASVDGARIFAERLLRRVRENVFCKKAQRIKLTATAGVLVLKPGHAILSSLAVLDRANAEMERAKKLGGDRFSLSVEPED
jgi:diguanylate cyclase (GGDEF)-like protein